MTRKPPTAIEVVSEPIAARLRAMTPAQRARLASDMHDAAVVMVTSTVKHEHPDWTEEQVRIELRRRFFGASA